MIKVFSSGIKKIENLSVFLKEEIASNEMHVVGWGHKPSARKAIRFAHEHRLAYLSLEDGFMRSVGLGTRGISPIGMIVEKKGCYYDANEPSETEELINSYENWFDLSMRSRVERLIASLIESDLSKYNIEESVAEDYLENTFKPQPGKKKLLVVDQTYEDASVLLGNAGQESFERMLKDALQRSDCEIFVKKHPETNAKTKKGYLEKLPQTVHVIDKQITPFSLLKQFDEVYTVTSQMGFDALLLGKRVRVYGTPFYAGWGFTEDCGIPVKRRQAKPPIQVLAAVIYIKLSRYVNPVTQTRFEVEEALDFVVNERNIYRENEAGFVGAGFKRWKKPLIGNYFKGLENDVCFNRDYAKALRMAKRTAASLLVWGEKCPQEIFQEAKESSVPVIRVEDGFIRSIGLGSDFNFPYSLVTDRGGMYYDPQSSSDLFNIIRTIRNRSDYPKLMFRARRLREEIVQQGLSKYNLSRTKQDRPEIPQNKKVCLVVGQVEDDVSFVKGGTESGIGSNLELLQEVRSHRPKDFIIYKPHPDVVVKNRVGAIDPVKVEKYADLEISDIPLADLFSSVDELHTLSSLSGFEALLRGLAVHTYGIPFYAGWGLTVDHMSIDNRNERLSLNELIASTLILYPRYFDWRTKRFCRPEDVCYRMKHRQQEKVSAWIHFCRLFRNWKKNVRMADR